MGASDVSDPKDGAQKLKLRICLGSSCHLRGAYEVARKLMEEFGKEDWIELSGSLCMGACSRGINAEVDGKLVSRLTPENAVATIRKLVEQSAKSNRNTSSSTARPSGETTVM